MIKKHFPIDVVGKPRMTQRDKWKKRPCVLRYRAFADELRLKVGPIDRVPYCVSWSAYIAMPSSWTEERKNKMIGQWHQQKPDRDNIDKAILDALFKDDSTVATGTCQKLWAREGSLSITIMFD